MYGEKLKKIRKQLGVTQEGMADLMNVPLRTYVSYERDENNPPYSMLVHLCIKYNINLNWFIANVGNMLIAPKFEDVREEILREVNKMLKERGL